MDKADKKEPRRVSAQDVTKSIRGKSNPIESQLQHAKDLASGVIDVFLPGKQVFILTWILEKLAPHKDGQYSMVVQKDLWILLRDVWNQEDFDRESRIISFRRHNFSVILQATFEDLKSRAEMDRISILEAMDETLESLLARSSGVRIRPQVDQGCVLLGSCLTLINELPSSMAHVRDRIVHKISRIFSSILHEDRPIKKVAKAFAINCLGPALAFLASASSESEEKGELEQCIADALFSAENLVFQEQSIDNNNLNASEFEKLLLDLKSHYSTQNQQTELSSDNVTIPILLGLALTALRDAPSTISAEQKSILAARYLFSLDAFSSSSNVSDSIADLSFRYLQKLNSLLRIFSQYEITSSDYLTSTLASMSSTCLSFLDFKDVKVSYSAWDALSGIMEIDFDVVLQSKEIFIPRLRESTSKFLKTLVTTMFKTREGVDFIKTWTDALLQSNAWTPNDVELSQMISDQIPRNLSSSQILELLEFLTDKLENEMILLPLKTIVSGIKSQDAVEHVSPILQRIFESPLKSQLREKSSSKSRSEAIFEVYYLILRLSDNIAIPLYDKKILSQARKLCKRDLVHFPLNCVLRFKEVGGLNSKATKGVDRITVKALEATLKKFKTELNGSSKLSNWAFKILDTLTRRWLYLISTLENESLGTSLAQIVFDLGAKYDHFLSHEGNPEESFKGGCLQLRFLMSSDLYERTGLVDCLATVLINNLELSPPIPREAAPITNGDIPKIGERNTQFFESQTWRRCLNAVRLIGRIPLDSFSRHNQEAIFKTLLLVDERLGSEHMQLAETGKTVDVLILLRKAIIRLIPKVSKFIIHVPFLPDVAYLKEDKQMTFDSMVRALNSFDTFPSEELYLTTVELIDELLGHVHPRYLSNNSVIIRSSSPKTIDLTNSMVEMLSKLCGSRFSVHHQDAFYAPYGNNIFALRALNCFSGIKERLESELYGFELGWLWPMKTYAVRQICGILEVEMTEKLSQCFYLLQSLRNLLMEKDVRIPVDFPEGAQANERRGIIYKFGTVFTENVARLHLFPPPQVNRTVRSLEEIFYIMCLEDVFKSPMTMCAAYIMLRAQARKYNCASSIDEVFSMALSKANGEQYDCILEEMSKFARENIGAIEALNIALNVILDVYDTRLSVSKVLFNLTRDCLRVSSSDTFIELLKLTTKILRERVDAVSKWNLDYIIANLTLTCSPIGPNLEGRVLEDEIFEAIGSAVLAILQLHHKRLTTKYHLIVRLLQTMLHVFINTSSTTPPKLRETVSRPPPWLKTSCSASSAQLFSRILSMWANPPSVTWHSSKSQESKRQLTSTAGKTAKAVSKHIPWFMMEYVALQAEYPLVVMEKPVQEALAPGLYALFDVLGTYEREMTMASLDNVGRGIFKKLWEEWSKFGRFTEN